MTASAGEDAPLADLAADLRVAVGRLARRLRTGAGGLSAGQLSVLVTIEAAQALTPGELAAREGIAAPTATRLAATLVESGLLERRPDPADRRSVQLRLSPAGAARLRDLRCEVNSRLAVRLADLPASERELLARAVPVLDRLAVAADAGPAGSPGDCQPAPAGARRARTGTALPAVPAAVPVATPARARPARPPVPPLRGARRAPRPTR